MASLRDFIPLEKLGEGSFSTVYKVKRVSDGKLYALKKVPPATSLGAYELPEGKGKRECSQ